MLIAKNAGTVVVSVRNTSVPRAEKLFDYNGMQFSRVFDDHANKQRMYVMEFEGRGIGKLIKQNMDSLLRNAGLGFVEAKVELVVGD